MSRYDELDEKRSTTGLTREEADELGRLEAERSGREYEGNADNPPPGVRAEESAAETAEATAQKQAAAEREPERGAHINNPAGA